MKLHPNCLYARLRFFSSVTSLTVSSAVALFGFATAPVSLFGQANPNTPAGALVTPRFEHTATLLADGRVLLAGGFTSANLSATNSAELYDPATNTWSATGSLHDARDAHGAVRLKDGRVLVVGGASNGNVLTAEIYDPATGAWSYTSSPSSAHVAFDPVLLRDGKVLVAGGISTAVGELYDPVTGTWSLTGSLVDARSSYKAVRLRNGKVLITGGNFNLYQSSPSELYDPSTGKFTETGSLNMSRSSHIAVLLRSGEVLVAGGLRGNGGKIVVLRSSELYDPATGFWTKTGDLRVGRTSFTGNLLRNGRVWVVGGEDKNFDLLGSIEEYNSESGLWITVSEALAEPRLEHTTTTLRNGNLLVAGGTAKVIDVPDAELFAPPH